MKIRIFTFLLYFCVMGATGLVAQRTHAFSAGVGTIYYYGDLTDKFNNSLVRPAGSISYSRYFLPMLSFRVGLTYGEVGAADAMAIDQARINRNLHFKSTIAEASGMLVFEFIKDRNFGNAWQGKPHITPFIMGGISFFYFNPKARINGTWYDLQPLGTEGQNIPGANPGPYSLVQASVPVGGGVSIRLSENMGVNFEVGYRTTFTDYLDDVSTVYPDAALLAESAAGGNAQLVTSLSNRSLDNQVAGSIRGNSEANDSYFFTMVSITYYLSKFASRD